MALLFNDASSQSGDNSSPGVTGYPFTLACWFYSDDATIEQSLVGIGVNGSADNRAELRIRGDSAGDPLQATSKGTGGSPASAATTSGYTANTWHHALGTFGSATSRVAYIDGGSSGSNATSLSLSGVNRNLLGKKGDGTTLMSGRIAEAAIWSVVLSVNEITALARGACPLVIRPASLVHYWPLIGRFSPEIDRRGGANMTLNNTPTAADHCRIFYPPRPQRYSFAAAVAATRSKRIVQGGPTNYGLAPGGLVA